MSSASRAVTSALYELRTYRLRLDRTASFLRETERLLHLRTQHSPVLGYWTSEMGGLNQVVHLWPYESLSQRARVRAALAGDAEWHRRYVAPVLNPSVLSQDNLLLRPADGTAVTAPAGTGVTELLRLTLRGAEARWLPALLRLAADGAGAAPAALVGCLRAALGPGGTALLLVRHPSQEALLHAAETRRHHPAYVDLLQHTQSTHSQLLLPLTVSPIQ